MGECLDSGSIPDASTTKTYGDYFIGFTLVNTCTVWCSIYLAVQSGFLQPGRTERPQHRRKSNAPFFRWT